MSGNSNYTLCDSWNSSGRELGEFENTIKDVLEATTFDVVKPEDLRFFHRLDTEGTEGVHKMVAMSSNSLMDYENRLTAAAVNKGLTPPVPIVHNLSASKLQQQLADESFRSNGFLMASGNTPLYVAESARSTLLLRAGLKGDMAAQPSFYMTAAIVDALSRKGGEVTLTIRMVTDPETGKKHHKVFSFLSGKYQDIDMNILLETIRAMTDSTMGDPVTKWWYMDQNFTEIYVEFPQAADDYAAMYSLRDKVVPGLLLMSSDTGSCSVIARGTARREGDNHYIVVEEYSHKHLGTVTPADILKEIEEHINVKLRMLPDALVDKMGKTIGAGDVSTPAGVKANTKAVAEAIKAGIKKLNLVKVLGCKRLSELKNQILNEIDGHSVYTQYDLCALFMGLSDRIEGLSRSHRLALAAACGNAPFIDLDAPSGSSIVLMPEEF